MNTRALATLAVGVAGFAAVTLRQLGAPQVAMVLTVGMLSAGAGVAGLLPTRGWTVAGLVMKQLGRLPRRGEAVNFDGFEFRVVRGDRRRIEGLRVTSPRDVAPPAEEG